MSFYLVLDSAQIHKNREFLNKAEVKFYSFVADNQLSLPGLDALMVAQSASEMRPHVRQISKEIMQKWEGVEIQNVRARHTFEFGDTGKVLYESEDIPDYLNWLMLVIELDEDIQNLAQQIDTILPDEDVDEFSDKLLQLLPSAPTPLTVSLDIAKFLIRKLTAFMAENKNDQLGLVEQSFIREMHYPKGKRTADEVPDLTGNLWYSYSLFGIT